MRGKTKSMAMLLVGAFASVALTTQAAEVLRYEGSSDLTDVNYWDGGELPGSTNVALFTSETVLDADGVTYTGAGLKTGAGAATWGFGGYKIVDTAGSVTFSEAGTVQYIYGLGVVVSNVTGDVTFDNIRCNKSTPSAEWYVHTDDTLRINYIAAGGGRSYYTIPVTGGGVMLVNVSAAVGSGTRMSFDVYGEGTTIGGIGMWQPNTCNTAYGMQIGTGAVISPGDNGVGIMTIDSLYDGVPCLGLEDGSIIKFELGSGVDSTYNLPSTDSDQVALTSMAAGDVVVLGTTYLDVGFTDSDGIYRLFNTDLDETTWSGLTVEDQVITGGFVMTNMINDLDYQLVMGGGDIGEPGDIYLVIGEIAEAYAPTNKIWAARSGTWDIYTSENWLNDDELSDFYGEEGGIGDYVTFNDSGLGGEITLNTNVYPSGLVVDSDADYAIAGSGSINGGVALLKSGSGALSVGSANNYYGGTMIGGGSVVLSTLDSRLGTGSITMTNDSSLVLYRGDSTSDGNYGAMTSELIVPEGQSVSVHSFPRGYWTGAVTGSGTLNLQVNYLRGEMQNNWSGFSGQLNVTSRTGSADEFRLASSYVSYDFSNAKVHLNDGVIMYMSGTQSSGAGTTHYIGELSGSADAILGTGPVGGRQVSWSIGQLGTDSTFEGSIQDYSSSYLYGAPAIGNLIKVGDGTLTLSGTNTYTGVTTVDGGTLAISGSIISPVTINGGTLAVSGSVTNAITVNGGMLSLSDSGQISNVVVAAGGAIDCRGTVAGNLSLDDGGMIAFSTNNVMVVSNSFVCANFGADDLVVDDWSNLTDEDYILVTGYTNMNSSVDGTEYYIGDGRVAHVADEGGFFFLYIDEASVVPDIASAAISDGSIVLSWESGAYNVYTNSDLANTNGWGVSTNANGSVLLPIDDENQLFYKLGY